MKSILVYIESSNLDSNNCTNKSNVGELVTEATRLMSDEYEKLYSRNRNISNEIDYQVRVMTSTFDVLTENYQM